MALEIFQLKISAKVNVFKIKSAKYFALVEQKETKIVNKWVILFAYVFIDHAR
jgi:hypothetical protein